MPNQPADLRPSHALPRRWLRVGVALVAVLVLHALAGFWLMRNRESFTPPPSAEIPVQIELLKPQPIERQPAPPEPKPVERPAAPKAAAPEAAPPKPAPSHEPVLTSTQTAEHGEPPAAAASAASGASGASGTQAASAAGTSAATPGPATSGVKFAAPPSGDLQYDTFYNGMQNMIGTIHWRTDGHTYDLSVSMPVPFVGPFTYRSEGRIDAFGVAPDRYVEKRGKRPEDIAIFNREIRQVVFTRTPNNAPLPDGVQDRFSMLMQLSGLLRGNPAAYKPGVTQQFFVIDNNSGETWPITVIGDEQVQTQAGIVGARHFMRLPRRDGDTRRIDMWLAPSLGWLPARLVQTEPNGAQIELLWHGRLAAPNVPADAAPGGATNAPTAASTPHASPAPPAEPAPSTPPATMQPPAASTVTQ
ncbi:MULTISPECIES: DUF3108 domain-containing protein [Burkholderia]|uniref:DUF3108 domain-containing protein n=1 Tax=Burkholderia TaxID=32008 RepID=UPI000679574C|nr:MULTISPECIES: DUF3108 domain-containing protein [Burkholderia]KWU26953.1 hypothetical protein AS149_24415 [Burkholderia cenocepacia]QRR14736.1 DUF3108 domain-containing protein [Burkholderia sp. MS389]CAG2295902.1 hypothetical protein BCCR75389_02989 [Burkholderia cenocepacia]CAG2296189.1 hypothetical protein BCCR75386_03005 [Burkholderia cenocepacia]CAG2296624.1 hypothetical protein BCCR75388_03007 [Burkholderia cenocepacia]